MPSTSNSNETNKPGEDKCPKCNGAEFVFSHYEEKGNRKYEIHKPCDCREVNGWKRRFKNALIPEEFVHANLENYVRETDMQQRMFAMVTTYLTTFPTDRDEFKKQGAQNLGFIATIGEQRIRSLPPNERLELKNKHNNFGIGKTHLQIALSKQLIKKGFNVLVVSDVAFMDEMMAAKRMDDNSETYYGLLNDVLSADVLVWDDIGKAKWTEAREGLYYHIINERYKRKLPIIFNSNEDRATIAERIGYAGASRLLDKNGDVLETEGIDWRLK
ncbi:ATP-binding protein [Lysinibacillus sp. NPDC096418]|uniref:ATP-binding protein n=1 Tax=Lysinibacillus sp. NPDC096418 TaxID=3364138 RepID=UPI0037F6A97B